MLKVMVIATVCLLSATSSAYAYIDPSIGAIALQGIIAAIASVGIALATFREKLRSIYRALTGKKAEDDQVAAKSSGDSD